MKIAFLTPEFPHPKTGIAGGIGTSIRNLSEGLAKAGHDISILVLGQDRDEMFTDRGISIYRIKNRKLKGFSWFLTRKKIEHLINQLHAEKKIDLIEAPDWTGITSFINVTCPVVVRLHGSDTYFCDLDHRPVKWSVHMHEKRALEKADALLSVSRYTADRTTALFGLTRTFTVIPNGVDTEAFQTSANIPERSTQILYFGTLVRKKGLLELPLIFNEVIRMNPTAKLVLVGRDASDAISGNASTWMMMKALFSKEALANVDYVGSVPYEKIREYIQSAAVCVFPTFAEALPVSWIEAMAMKKAIVASDIGWAPEVIDDGKSGFLVHPEKHLLFAEKVNSLLTDAELRHNVSQAARVHVVEKFGLEVVVHRNLAFYESILNKS